MDDFLQAVKTSRYAEIASLESKGYSCNKTSYKFKDYFTAYYDDKSYFRFGVFATLSERWFLCIEETDDSEVKKIIEFSEYLSLSDLLFRIKCAGLEDIVSRLHEFGTIKQKLVYRKSIFSYPFLDLDDNTKRRILNSGKMELFVLLALIQAKSNLYFKGEQYSQYRNGIYRLFSALTMLHQNHPILEKRNWLYNTEKDWFSLSGPGIEFRALKIEFFDNSDDIFVEELKNAKERKEKANVFLTKYNELNNTDFKLKTLVDEEFLKPTDISSFSKKEVERIKTMKPFANNNSSSFITTNPVYQSHGKKSYLLLIWKFNKKYYLTRDELEEIIKSNPSKSSIYDGGGGSDS